VSGENIYTKNELIGKQVVTNDAKLMGVVKDIAFDSTGKPGFVVALKGGEESFILTAQIIALGDVLLVKSRYQCPKCGHFNKETASFCVKCGSNLLESR